MTRGGAGTGKTVVAMHRAKYLADIIEANPTSTGQRVLVTTFTTSLAHDIEANLKTLCPEHFSKFPPRIEVKNLDAWVGEFLKKQLFARRIAYFGEDLAEIDTIWDQVFSTHTVPAGLSREFVKAEWAQVVQAKGVDDLRGYLKVSRAGRGTPLDRQIRAKLWELFEDYRARLLDAGLAEPDDAYREAVTLLEAGAIKLPYSSVVIDEAQDMGEQAFRLVRAIVRPHATGDQNSLFIVGDAHQRIYARKASMSACGIDIRGRSRKLRLNYRTTDDIRRWAVSVLEGVSVDDLDDGSDNLLGYVSLMRGPQPDASSFKTQREEVDALTNWVRKRIEARGREADIAILARTNVQLDRVEKALVAVSIGCLRLTSRTVDSPNKSGVRLATMHRAKGLEFRDVAIPFLSKDEFPPGSIRSAGVDAADSRMIMEREKSLLHVAGTRAKETLRLSWSGDRTALLK